MTVVHSDYSVLIVLIAAAVVVFWRLILGILLAALAACVIYGALMIAQQTHPQPGASGSRAPAVSPALAVRPPGPGERAGPG